MASNDFANTAAATAAGYALLQVDRGVTNQGSLGTTNERFMTMLEKMVGGVAGDPSVMVRAFGYGATQAAADSACVASLNNIRSNRYGFDSAAPSSTVHALPVPAAGSASAPAAAATATVKHSKDNT